MTRFVDAVITYRILKKLVTPFDETAAFRLGIIDRKGKLLRKDADLRTDEEREAYTVLDRLVWRLKRIIEKVPTDNKRLLSLAAALTLIKEHANDATEAVFLEREFISIQPTVESLNEVTDFMTGQRRLSFRMHAEEGVIANAVGAGFSSQANPNPNPNLAGRDLGLKKSRLLRRKIPNV
jgi:hypothetical protein